MRSSPFRLALPLAALLAALPLGRLLAADEAPAAPAPAAAPVAAPAKETAAPAAVPAAAPAPALPSVASAKEGVVDQDTADAKLAVVLRSFTLLQEENDRLKAAQEKSDLEKSALEAQLAEAKKALPLAAQTVGLREQLRQTQDQLAAVSLENNELKTRLATGGAPAPGKLSPVAVPTTLTPAVMPAPAPAAPEVKYHVVATGDTLGKISRQYYGTTSRWPEILAANKDVLKDENSLKVGAKLRIP